MKYKDIMMFGLLATTGLISFSMAIADPVVSDVVAKQRYPWNGKVDITYTLMGDVTAGFAPDNQPVLQITATDNTTGETYVADASALSGYTGTAEGIHHVIWDLNAQGLELNSDDVTFAVAYAEPSLYCVIDLSAGANATSYPVSYLSDVPEGGWSDEYKTTKLVLRCIEPGDIPTRDARITKPFYCGVFEVTQKQWELVMGSNPSQYQGDMRPVERVSYNMIRGSSAGSQWPASSAVDGSSFMGKIREKTGIVGMDLPTDAQWEYACRAGTISAYNNGGDFESDLRSVGRYYQDRSDGKGGFTDAHTTVGSYLPNAWGLYDMHGNVWEWCLDWYGEFPTGNDAVGLSSGANRVGRCGSWYGRAQHNTSSQREGRSPSVTANDLGFRLANNMIGGLSPNLVLCSADSAAVVVDSRDESVVDSVVVAWDASWIGGDAGATVVIEDNGTIVTNTTGAGEFTHTLTGDGRHDLTYTTYICEVAQDEVYKTVVYKGKYIVHFDSNGGEGAMDDCEFVIDMPSALPQWAFTKDGYFLLGWALTPDGDATLLDGDTTADIVAENGETVTLYAVWHEGVRGSNGLSVKYYDISSSGYSTWTQSEAAMTNYFAAYTPTIVTNTLAFGGTLQSGFQQDVSRNFPEYSDLWGNQYSTNRYHGKYAYQSQNNFAMQYEGSIKVGVGGDYTFGAACDDQIVIYIDGKRICSTSEWTSPSKGNVTLESGYHRFSVATYENGGYQGMFVEWKKPGDTAFSPLPQAVLSDGNAHAYAVRFDANGGNGSMQKQVYAIDDDVMFPDDEFTRDGWTLVGWAVEPEGPAIYPAEGSIEGGIEAANGETITLYARWAQSRYNVHFDANGGEGAIAYDSLWIGIPDWLSSNVFTRVGYTFAGWATVTDGEVEYGDRALVTNLTETADATANLYAVWSPNEYQVTFDANGGEGGWSETMDYGTEIVAPEVSRIGYTFKGWDKEIAATVPDEDLKYVAQWEINRHAIIFDANGGEGGWSETMDYGTEIVAPEVSRIGWTFKGWDKAIASAVPDEDVTYTAQWEINQYTVTFDANGGVGGLSAMQDYDSEIMPPVVSRVGCTFEGWLPSPDAKVPDHNVEYVAQWKVWDITVDSVASSVKELYPYDYFRITNIVIGAEVESLPAGFFDGCDALESLAFLSSETELGDNDLRTVGRLYETQPDGYWVVQGVLFGYKGICPREIPGLDSVKRVVDCALEGCKALGELNFTAESVLTTIGTNAFKHCTELQRMTLPPSLEEIGNEAFMGCSYIGNVIVPGSVKRVGDRAFKNCTGFTAAQIAYGVESLGEEAFYGDWRISEVDIPSTVTNIGVNAFGGDSSIIRVGLRGDVRPAREIFSNYRSIREATVKEGDGEIVDGLFSGFSLLQDVHFLGNCPALANDGQLLYMNTPDKTVDYGGGNVINALVTYVEQNSTGWDGIPGSHSLPQAWPLVGSYRRSIAWWNVPTYLCQFDANGGTLGVQDTYQYSERLITLPPEPVQTGYTFAGWWTQPIGGLRVTADTIFIEGVYTHLYAHWTKGHWVFLDPNGGTVVNDFVTYVEQSVYGVLPTPVRSGYSFGGWLYNGYRIEPETEINEKADHTLVAQWTANLYSVRYNANGGDGDMDEQGFVYGVEQELRKNLFARSGYEFIGWATNAVDAVGLEEETDAVVYADCESVTNLTAVADGWIELFAVWKESDVLPDPSNLDFHFSGDAKWELRYEGVTVEKDGETLRYATVWRSESIAHNQKSVLVANVYGAGKIGFWWKVSCESFRDWKLDNLEFAIDGVAQEPWINGEKDWAYVEFEVETSGAHTLTWTYSKDEEGSDGEDCGWITAAVWTPKLESLGDYVNSPTLEFSSSGNLQWQGDKAISHDGIASLRSGAIGDGEVSTLEAEVEGAGRIGFWWKVSSEAFRNQKIDYVSFSIDDVEQAWMSGEIGWTNVAFDVVGNGTHTLRWEYRKDNWADTKSGEDCAWLDEVVWTPAGGGAVEPAVEGDDKAVVTGDKESGYTVRPSDGKKDVVVTIPEGVEPEKVTVEVSADVETVRANGANVKVMNEGYDIAAFLDLAAVTSAGGVINLAEAKVKDEVAKEALDTASGADIKLSPTDPSITTANTRPGLKYTFVEGQTIEELAPTEQYKWGDNTPFKPTPSIKGGTSGFYTIKVEK